MTNPTVKVMLLVARSELGYREEPFRPGEAHTEAGTNRTKFAAEAGHANGLPWCATFEVALAHRIGLALPPGCDTASVYQNLAGWQRAGQSRSQPQPGDFVHFRIGAGHTGILVSAAAGQVTTIDGNTLPAGVPGDEANGGEVCQRIRPTSLVLGYGRPLYTPSSTPIGDDEMNLGPRATARRIYMEKWGHEPDNTTLDHGHFFLGQVDPTGPTRDADYDNAVAFIYDHEVVAP